MTMVWTVLCYKYEDLFVSIGWFMPGTPNYLREGEGLFTFRIQRGSILIILKKKKKKKNKKAFQAGVSHQKQWERGPS